MAAKATQRARRRWPAAALLLASVGLSGCGGARLDALETEVSRQREELSEMRRNQASQRVQFDEFRNRLVVLQDKLESERLAAQRSARAAEVMPQLPRVIVAPGEGHRAPDAVGADPAAQPTPPRSVVIGPDGVARVARPDTEAEAEPADARARSGRRPSVAAAGPSQSDGARPPHEGNTAEEAAAGAYREAKALLDTGRLDEARTGFEGFLAGNADHPLADNALYWIGETYYAKSLWLKAARVFGEVASRFPRGNKVPDAMLKTALCYQHLGERQLCHDVLAQLTRLYPGAPAADQARERLRRLEEQR